MPLNEMSKQNSLSDLVKKVVPSVVAINVFDEHRILKTIGTGFFVKEEGVLVTNYHVIEEGIRAEAKLADGQILSIEGVLLENMEEDLALLSTWDTKRSFPALKLADSDVEIGQSVFVVGSPFGFEGTVSDGIVSAVRDIPQMGRLLQITAPISKGSSGGPVLNLKGEVVGVATCYYKEGQNLNFAIPVDRLINLLSCGPMRPRKLSEWPRKKEAWSDSSFGLWAIATYFLENCNYNIAIDYLKRSIQKDPTFAEAYCNLGVAYGKLGLYYEAAEAYKHAIRVSPNHAYIYCNLGSAYGELGRNYDAVEAFQQSIRIDPNYAEAYHGLGVGYYKLGRHHEAVETFKEGIQIAPDNVSIHYNLGITYRDLGSYSEAIEALKQAIQLKPDFTEAYNDLGIICGELGHYDQAVQAFKQAIQINPDNVEAHNNLGASLGELGRNDEAIMALEQAIQRNPNYADAYYNLGRIYGKLGRYIDAIEAFKQAIRINPDYADAHRNLGVAYLVTGDKILTLEQYKILKKLDEGKAAELFNLIYK